MKCTACSHIIRPIVSLDIDGTLGDYHLHFIRFAENYLGQTLPPAVDYTGAEPFWQYLGLELRVYREAKLAYRQGGTKRWMPAFPGASWLTQELRRAGAEIWICTTRPYMRLDNIDPDTREWLARNGIVYDHMLYGETKYEQLAETVDTARVVGVLEDLPEQAEVARGLGMSPVVRARPYNAAYRAEAPGYGLAHADTLAHACDLLTARVEAWRETNGRG